MAPLSRAAPGDISVGLLPARLDVDDDYRREQIHNLLQRDRALEAAHTGWATALLLDVL